MEVLEVYLLLRGWRLARGGWCPIYSPAVGIDMGYVGRGQWRTHHTVAFRACPVPLALGSLSSLRSGEA